MIAGLLKRMASTTTVMLQNGQSFDLFNPVSEAGMVVNRETALKYDPIWRGVSILAADVAKMRPFVWKRLSDDFKDKEIERFHPTMKLVRKPGPFLTWRNFVIPTVIKAILSGNGYGLILRDGSQMPMELRLLDDATPQRVKGDLFYRTYIDDSEQLVRARDIFHLRGISLQEDEGINMVSNARDSIGLGMAAEQHGATFFKNQGRPATVVVHPNKLPPETMKLMKEMWDRGFTGKNAHKTAFLSEGVDLKTISTKNNENQFVETMDQRLRAMGNWTGTPSHKLGDRSAASFASLESEERSYLANSLDPWLVAMEDEMNDKLLSLNQIQTDSHCIQYDRRQMVQALLADRGQYYNQGITGGWLSPNEARAGENLPPIEGGDRYAQQAQMQDISEPSNDPSQQDGTDDNGIEPDEERQAWDEIFEQTMRRLARRMSKNAGQKTQELFSEQLAPLLALRGIHTVDIAALWVRTHNLVRQQEDLESVSWTEQLSAWLRQN